MTDKKLISRLKSSPEEGLRECVLTYSAYVLKICRIKLSGSFSGEDTEEAVSDIFFKFYRYGLKSGFEISSVRGLLSVIAARHCDDMLRAKYRRPETVSLEELDKELYDSGGFGEGESELAAALHSLGRRDEEIFIRKYYLSQKSKEIAADLGMTQNTVDKHISRGLEKLRKKLKEEDL